MAEARDTVDVVIVGGGPAGLATAYHLRDSGLRTLVLEADSQVGGRARSVEFAGEFVNTGAMFVYRGTPSHDLAVELGLALEPFEPATYGVHLDGTTAVSGDYDDLVARLPLADPDRAALRDFIELAIAEYRAMTEGGALTAASARLADQTADARLAELPEAVSAIAAAAITGGSVALPSQLSAQYALRYFASYLAHDRENRLLMPAGMQRLPEALAAALPGSSIRTGTRVVSVTGRADGTWDISTGTERTTIHARSVVLAVPEPVVPQLCDLPAWKLEALAKVDTPGSTTLSVVADVSDLAPPAQDSHIQDWSFVATPGRVFDAIINPRPGRRDGLVQMVCYGNSARYLPEATTDPALTEEWLAEFLLVAPALRGRILGAHLQSWPHCFSLLTPTRAEALDALRAPVGTMHFAGDYTSTTAGTHGAYAEAARVASQLR